MGSQSGQILYSTDSCTNKAQYCTDNFKLSARVQQPLFSIRIKAVTHRTIKLFFREGYVPNRYT